MLIWKKIGLTESQREIGDREEIKPGGRGK